MLLVVLMACMAWASNVTASHVHTGHTNTPRQGIKQTDPKSKTISGPLHAKLHKNIFGEVSCQKPAKVVFTISGLTVAPEKCPKPKNHRRASSDTPLPNAVFNHHKSSYALLVDVSFSSPNNETFRLAFDTSNPSLTTLSATGQRFLADADGMDNKIWQEIQAYDVETTGRIVIKGEIQVNISPYSKFTADEYIDDEVHIGGQLARKASVLVAYNAELIKPIDGIFGISPEASVFSHMEDLPEHVIGLELQHFTKDGGSFTIGTVSKAYGDLQFVNIVKKQANPLLVGKDLVEGKAYDLFAVDDASLTVDGNSIKLSGAILDTSLAITFLPREAFKAFEKAFSPTKDPSFVLSYMLPCQVTSALKRLSFNFGGAKLTFNKLALSHNGQDSLCISAIQPWDQTYAAIGSHILLDNYVALYLKTDTQEPKVGIASKHGHATKREH
ncbi:aspartic peptidase domain-containing protein [Protomyces lactucae-debilis]|uniref:Aspartic peptidase domain-containing protein n=1 Tax=Protomyces lactucae-debilis TaxID=2754530 RepID=A0A1Y2F7J2_PROLT|nr:aspartic peptidase domain-containing protein [Protomyces lactucae-debilis]ORY79829.1 aspartic peptidase domain-containing protein [Protomyces lactucae-debilis]